MAKNTRERMLDTTASLLQRRGFHGTSLNEILAASGAPRGSLYYHFPRGKEQIVLEATERGVARVTKALEECLAGGHDPVRGVRAYIEAAAEELRASGYAFGCPVAPVVLDVLETPSALADICRRALEEWQRMLRDGLAAARVPPKRASSLATMTVAALEGALLLARAQRDTAPLDIVADEISAWIAAALPGRSRKRRRSGRS